MTDPFAHTSTVRRSTLACHDLVSMGDRSTITIDDILTEPVLELCRKSSLCTVAAAYDVNELVVGPSPPGRGRREAPGEGRKTNQILRPSPTLSQRARVISLVTDS